MSTVPSSSFKQVSFFGCFVSSNNAMTCIVSMLLSIMKFESRQMVDYVVRYMDFYFCAQVCFQLFGSIDDGYTKTMSRICMLEVRCVDCQT